MNSRDQEDPSGGMRIVRCCDSAHGGHRGRSHPAPCARGVHGDPPGRRQDLGHGEVSGRSGRDGDPRRRIAGGGPSPHGGRSLHDEWSALPDALLLGPILSGSRSCTFRCRTHRFTHDRGVRRRELVACTRPRPRDSRVPVAQEPPAVGLRGGQQAPTLLSLRPSSPYSYASWLGTRPWDVPNPEPGPRHPRVPRPFAPARGCRPRRVCQITPQSCVGGRLA